MAARQASVTTPVAARAGPGAPGQSTIARRLGAWLDRQSPWRLRAIAFLLGALATAALPGMLCAVLSPLKMQACAGSDASAYALPALIVSFSGLVLLADRTPRPLAAIALGWCFALGYFVAGIYWVANALLSVASNFGWLLPFAIAGAVGGLSALLAVFPAFAVGLARLLWPAGPARILVLAIAWTLFEWLRSWVLTGFPWNLVGTCWAFSDAMNQLAALTGVWGLSLVTVIAAALPALLVDWDGRRAADGTSRQRGAAAVAWVAGSLVLLLAIWVGGWFRLYGTDVPMVPDVRLRLVQANVTPNDKAAGDRREDVLNRHLHLTRDKPGVEGITDVVWSETAAPYPLAQYLDRLAEVVPQNGLLITGAIRTDPPQGEWREVWNSMAVVDRSGRILDSYDKFHLVPFGEYVPLHRFLPFISKFTPGIADFSAGPGPRTLRLPGLPPVGPLICYEVIFPGQVVDRGDRPQWLLNITNDGWYGISAGPYQHFVSARLRAVEEGLPLVRAANTGISGLIDPYGRVVAQTRLGEATALDVELPKPLPQLTPYARWGDAVAAGLLVIVALVALVARRRN